jgi:hypothetical protein
MTGRLPQMHLYTAVYEPLWMGCFRQFTVKSLLFSVFKIYNTKNRNHDAFFVRKHGHGTSFLVEKKVQPAAYFIKNPTTIAIE